MMGKGWKRFLLTGALAAFMVAGLPATDVAAKAVVNGFDLQAHRGGRDARAENTLYAFAYAMELGVTTLEMDMQLTKDGRLVISHNPVMNWMLAKGPDGQYAPKQGAPDIRTMTLVEVQQYDLGVMNPAAGGYYDLHGKTQIATPGAQMPTLEQVFELANAYGNKKVIFNIETKSYADPEDPYYANSPDPDVFVEKVYEVVKKYNMQNRVTIQSFDWRTLKAMKAIAPELTLVALSSEQPSWGKGGMYLRIGEKAPSPHLGGLNINDFKGDYVKAAKEIGADVVSPYFKELSPDLIDEAHALGMKVVPWTVNSPKDMEMLLAMGVDGIISDQPWVLRDVLIKKGIAVPEPTPAPKGMKYSTGTAINKVEVKKAKGGADASH
ncbi:MULTISPECIES: glycerophosphodiester phosphodiesterase [Anaeromusa]|uniref:glycerophosphodiester phosphodiesterase n=1 Tax=Anaeromusa TaxID=81463 RepID=UPI0003789CB5|nr:MULTISPECIES: glycerophosphodiester phosphodiesterase [Anaeromusa]MDD3156961.1 glycerophosphodiester phosphodiesterase [Anaeromusa sp.]